MGEFWDKLLYGYDYKKHKTPEATLSENMATITTPQRNKYGIIVVVRSSTTDEDTSNTGVNEHRPPHAHLFDRDKKELGKFILSNETDRGLKRYTSSLPKSKDDIKELGSKQTKQGKGIEGDYKTRLFRYMTDKDEEGRFATNWERTIDTWNKENESWKIDYQG